MTFRTALAKEANGNSGYRCGQATTRVHEKSWSDTRYRQEVPQFQNVQTGSGTHQASHLMGKGRLHREVIRPECEANHSHPCVWKVCIEQISLSPFRASFIKTAAVFDPLLQKNKLISCFRIRKVGLCKLQNTDNQPARLTNEDTEYEAILGVTEHKLLCYFAWSTANGLDKFIASWRFTTFKSTIAWNNRLFLVDARNVKVYGLKYYLPCYSSIPCKNDRTQVHSG
jgi:hypothetical protein